MPRKPPSRNSFIMKLPVSIWPMAASPRSRLLLLLGEPGGVGEHRAEEGDDDQAVDDLLVEIGCGIHAATSRFFKMR